MNSARHCFFKRKCQKSEDWTMNDMENGTYHLVMTKLSEDSYGRWIVDIQDVLEGAGLWRIANGSLMKPTPVTGFNGSITNVGNIEDWEKDSRARALIRRTLESVTFDQVVDCVNSASILKRIREMFEPKTVNMLMGALREFFVLTWKPEDTVSSFVAGLRVIVRRIESCESSDLGKVNDKWIIAKILGTLPSEYGHFVTTWDLLSSSSVKLDLFVEKLVNAERSLRSRNTEPVVVDAYRLSNSPKKVKDDRKKARSIDGKQSKFNGICYRCKKHGHMSRDCRVKIEDKTESSSDVNSLSAATATKVTDRIIADSGASVHLTGRFDWFESVRKLSTSLRLNIADGDKMRATHVGRIRIKKSIDGIRWEQRFWDDVYYAEGMSDSLFSIAYMETKKGYSFFFGNGKMRMMNDNNIIFGGERKGSVYVPYLRVMTPSGHASKAVSTAVLHQRFGHVNNSLIRLMEKNNLVEGLVIGQGKRDVCDSCFL